MKELIQKCKDYLEGKTSWPDVTFTFALLKDRDRSSVVRAIAYNIPREGGDGD